MKIHNLISLIFLFSIPISADQCGKKSSVATCPLGICSGACGSGFLRRCGSHIQFAIPGGDGGGISNILNSSNFELMLKYRNDPRCPSSGFYSYTSFISAANSFDGFGTTGNPNIRKRELAAFLAQTSHETTGGWATAPDGPYAWGYCYVNETSQDSYCIPSPDWPCASGKKYYGRGPIQITYNFNYGRAGRAIGVDLLNKPDLVATDPTISFRTALWFWMTPRGNNIPSSHDVITGSWIPSNDDTSARRVPGYGVITNIINGNLECGIEQDSRAADRIGFYKRYCDILGVGYGDNLDCSNQKPFS